MQGSEKTFIIQHSKEMRPPTTNLLVAEEEEARGYNEYNLLQRMIASSNYFVWNENGLIQDIRKVTIFTVYLVCASLPISTPRYGG